jgi:hypothetical protein
MPLQGFSDPKRQTRSGDRIFGQGDSAKTASLSGCVAVRSGNVGIFLTGGNKLSARGKSLE